MRQLGQLSAPRRLGPLEPGAQSIDAIDVDTLQKEHVEVDVCIERTAEALDQRHRTGVTHLHLPGTVVCFRFDLSLAW